MHGTRQDGMVLIITLVFLLLLALLMATVSMTNSLQLQMAGNDEAKMAVSQAALAIVDKLFEDSASRPPVDIVGYRTCAKDALPADEECDAFELLVPVELLDADANIEYYVERMGPLASPMPHLSETTVSSATSFKVAREQITVAFDRSERRLGATELIQGYLRLVSRPAATITVVE